MKSTGFWVAAKSSALLIALTNVQFSQAAPPQMPTDVTWDCLVNGSQGRGIAFLSFHDDSTFSGAAVMTVNPPAATSGSSSNPRGPVVDSRGTTTSGGSDTTQTPGGSSTATPAVNVYGYGLVDGRWGYDSRGNVIGYFYQVITDGQGTNAVSVTNSIGFKAILTGQRMTLVASTPNRGKSTYLGVRMNPETARDISGPWYGKQSGTGQTLVEFFDLYPTEQQGLYNIFGSGANYDMDGWVMLSSRKRIAVAVELSGTKLMRSSVGTYHPAQRKALTSGIIEPGTRIRFNAYRYE